MNYYVYRNQNITIKIWANDENSAFQFLIDRINGLELMDVWVPSAQDFDLVSVWSLLTRKTLTDGKKAR